MYCRGVKCDSAKKAVFMPVKWNDTNLLKLVGKSIEVKLGAIGALLETDIKRSLSTPGPTKTNPMQPASGVGESPHRRTGRLRRSITHEVDTVADDVVRVGTNVEYGFWLEKGTSGFPSRNIPPLAPRPFLRPAIDEADNKIAFIWGRPL